MGKFAWLMKWFFFFFFDGWEWTFGFLSRFSFFLSLVSIIRKFGFGWFPRKESALLPLLSLLGLRVCNASYQSIFLWHVNFFQEFDRNFVLWGGGGCSNDGKYSLLRDWCFFWLGRVKDHFLPAWKRSICSIFFLLTIYSQFSTFINNAISTRHHFFFWINYYY